MDIQIIEDSIKKKALASLIPIMCPLCDGMSRKHIHLRQYWTIIVVQKA